MTGETELAAQMPNVAAALLGPCNRKLSTPGEWRYGRRGSLAVDVQRGVWCDHEAGTGGGVLALIMRQRGGDAAAARRWLSAGSNLGSEMSARPRHDELRRKSPSIAERSRYALKLWHEAQPAAGSPVAAYLASRGLRGILHDPDLAAVLRFAPTCPFGPDGKRPAMLSLLSAIDTGAVCGVRRTALAVDGRRAIDSDGRKLPHMTLGAAAGAVVRLSGGDVPHPALAVCEGVETGLSLVAAGVHPVWACTSAGTLATLPRLAGVERLVVFADHDPPGLAAARAVAKRWEMAGCEAVVRVPDRSGDDFNDVWMEAQHAR
jgi:putative DNA primase/helicase